MKMLERALGLRLTNGECRDWNDESMSDDSSTFQEEVQTTIEVRVVFGRPGTMRAMKTDAQYIKKNLEHPVYICES